MHFSDFCKFEKKIFTLFLTCGHHEIFYLVKYNFKKWTFRRNLLSWDCKSNEDWKFSSLMHVCIPKLRPASKALITLLGMGCVGVICNPVDTSACICTPAVVTCNDDKGIDADGTVGTEGTDGTGAVK